MDPGDDSHRVGLFIVTGNSLLHVRAPCLLEETQRRVSSRVLSEMGKGKLSFFQVSFIS